jgi:hypothetical protein
MPFIFKNSFKTALRGSWVILKLIVPIYIIADVLFYYDILSYITFLFKPLVSLLGLPEAAALSIVSGLFLNLYAAIAFAAPIGLSTHEWTILAVFLGIAHALLVETEIMKKLGISRLYSIGLRLGVGFCAGFLVSILPSSWFEYASLSGNSLPEKEVFTSIVSLLQNALIEALVLSAEVICLVSALVFFLDFLKSRPWIQHHSQKLNSGFSITVGVILGITYGAGILIAEYEKGILQKREILFIGTYLMICHAIIEDTLLFVLFGANIWVIVSVRVFFATLFAYGVLKVWKKT